MSYRCYTEEQFIQAVKDSFSMREVMLKLGLNATGGSYRTIKKYVEKLKLDTSHFTGKLWNKGKKTGYKRPIEDYLSNQAEITSHHLRLRLISDGYLANECAWCHLTEWRGKPIPLELDHINGNHEDNSLENLRILCRNCHGQTETFRRPKKERETFKPTVEKESNKCIDCQCSISKRSERCKICAEKHLYRNGAISPSDAELIIEACKTQNISQVARQFKTSRTTVRNVLRRCR